MMDDVYLIKIPKKIIGPSSRCFGGQGFTTKNIITRFQGDYPSRLIL